MCSALKWVCRCLQGHLDVCGHTQTVSAGGPPGQHVTVACKPLLARSGASCEVCASDSSRAKGARKASRAGGYAGPAHCKSHRPIKGGWIGIQNYPLTMA